MNREEKIKLVETIEQNEDFQLAIKVLVSGQQLVTLHQKLVGELNAEEVNESPTQPAPKVVGRK